MPNTPSVFFFFFFFFFLPLQPAEIRRLSFTFIFRCRSADIQMGSHYWSINTRRNRLVGIFSYVPDLEDMSNQSQATHLEYRLSQ